MATLALAAAWFRGRQATDLLALHTPGGTGILLANGIVNEGRTPLMRLICLWTEFTPGDRGQEAGDAEYVPDPPGWSVRRLVLSDDESGDYMVYGVDCWDPAWLPLRVDRGVPSILYSESPPFYDGWQLRAPYWAMLAMAFAPAACIALSRFGRTVRKRRRHAGGLCLACGYDLRASRERCPECGGVILE